VVIAVSTSSARRIEGPTDPDEASVSECDSPFVLRQAQRRKQLRDRCLARVRVPLAPELHVHRTVHRLPSWLRVTLATLALLASAAAHVGFVCVAFGLGRLGGSTAKPRTEMTIELREHEPQPQQDEGDDSASAPTPEPETVVRPKPVDTPKPTPPRALREVSAPAKVAPKAKVARVVGLSFESTVGETPSGGAGFAVGTNRLGETALQANPPGMIPPGGGEVADALNATATHVPGSGVRFKPAKRRRAVVPAYPPTLKAQGIEGQVPVIVWIDADGKVTAVRIIRESPYAEFNENAKRAAMADEFEPATRDGVPVATTLKYNVTFRLTVDS
jgi:TonB family protein